MSKTICPEKNCTACHACECICPNNAISFQINTMGNSISRIDVNKCVNCNKCVKACPNNSITETYFKKIKKTYAAWSTDRYIRQLAASGGVASTFQKNCIKQGIITYGVAGNFGGIYKMKRITKESEIKDTANSKYAYSDATDVISDIGLQLQKGNQILFIGTPCQVAAIKSLYGDSNKLILVDLVCHGMPPINYYLEHCSFLKNRYKRKSIKELRFRTNNNYNPVLLDDIGNECVLSRFNDTYAVGFHGGAIFQESCYSCKFARSERISDITLGDYWGLEDDPVLKHQFEKGITAILVNTNKGLEVLPKICMGLEMMERKPEEVVSQNGQLKAPPKVTKSRKFFLRFYPIVGFEAAARFSFGFLSLKQRLSSNRKYIYLKRLIKKTIRKKYIFIEE